LPVVLVGIWAVWTLSGLGELEAVAAPDTGASASDEQILKAANVGTKGPELLAFFRNRTLSSADVARIGPLVEQLGAAGYKQRKNAKDQLIRLGPPVLSELRRIVDKIEKLKRVQTDTEQESLKQANMCVETIARTPGPALPLAALRLLESRKPEGCCQVLLGYLPFADNKEVEEEVFEALLTHGRNNGTVDPVLPAALKDKHALRRAAAAYALGRMGDVALRPGVRALLADAEPSVRQWAAYGLVGKEIYRSADEAAKGDQALFTAHKLPADDAGLLALFRKRTLSEADQAHLQELVVDLGSKNFRKRSRASRELAEAGSPALPLLRSGATNVDVEIASRARRCIVQIETGPGKALALAGLRQIMRRAPAEGLETLLGYIPFADDLEVEQEALYALCALACRDVKLSPALSKALTDAKPARRAAAAHVLGRVGSRADCQQVRARLSDNDPKVRYQAAQVLLADRDQAAIPVLVALLEEAPFELAQMAEDLLGSTTGAQPTKGELTADKAVRKQARAAWSGWWEANRGKVELTGAVRDTPQIREQKARKVCLQSLNALLHLNAVAFKKTLRFPIYMEGINPAGGDPQVNSGEQIDAMFKMLEGQGFKQFLNQMTFKVTGVGRLGEYLEYARDREKVFLNKLRKAEVYVVYVTAVQNGMMEHGGGAMFVRMAGGRAWVVGMGNSARQVKKK
jgi:HEAT repeat protein